LRSSHSDMPTLSRLTINSTLTQWTCSRKKRVFSSKNFHATSGRTCLCLVLFTSLRSSWCRKMK
jgi:hypothetical protein